MNKEAVRLNLDGVTSVLPYRDYYRGRNGLVAQNLARYLDLPYRDENGVGNNEYVVLPVALNKAMANRYGIRGESDFYGGVFEHLNHISKAILHPCVSMVKPVFYSDEFARSVKDLVIPGVTAFSKQDLMDSYAMFRKEYPVIRLKMTTKSDGHGQYRLSSVSELASILEQIPEEEVRSDGLVIETNLENKKTVSIGRVVVGDDKYYFLARQKNDRAPEDDRDRYMGADVLIVKDETSNLFAADLDVSERKALDIGSRFLDCFGYFNPICSRLSFDCLIGNGPTGEDLIGVTDITARLGGTCPALSLAILEFKKNPGLSLLNAEVNLNYSPGDEKPEERGAMRFIDLPSLRLTARINNYR